FEPRVRNIRIRPFDENRLSLRLAERANWRRNGISFRVQTREVLVVRLTGSGHSLALEMDRVEFAVARVIGVEFETDESARQQVIDDQAVKDARLTVETVQVQICGDLLRFLVDNVKGPVQVIHEESVLPHAGLLA